MTFLAPWAFAVGVLGSLGIVLLHLVARTRPAAYVLPTTRFVPDQRSLVSRVATRPRDLLLLLLRVLLLLVASAAFARPVLTPSRGTVGHIVLVDRSRAVANMGEAIAKARTLVPAGAPAVTIAFDSAPALAGAGLDSLASVPRSDATGSLTAALVAARRASVALSEQVDSVALHLVSPLAQSELDGATAVARRGWPGTVDVARVALRTDSANGWRLERPIAVADPLGPAVAGLKGAVSGRASNLVRGPLSANDSAFARSGGTVVRWDASGTARIAADGLSVGDDVIVASLGRLPLAAGERVVARWADGTPAAVEETIGTGCVRHVGVLLPAAGDLPLHPSFQRLARGLLAPCGYVGNEVAIDSMELARVLGGAGSMASARDLRAKTEHSSPLARWLLLAALVLALAELAVRTRGAPEMAA
ncbi:MAG: BatA domain-containing protein [Gemmatimonadota bacterium]|nr:BatA domain-containing protein [Gemmatimonadota bacterium]